MVLTLALSESLAATTWRVPHLRMENIPSGQRGADASTLNNQSRTAYKRQSSILVVGHGANHTAL